MRFGPHFQQSLAGVTLPSSLQTLTFGFEFNQSLAGVALPSSLQTLTFGVEFNHSLAGVTLPSSLQTLSFGIEFNQSLAGVTLPSSLQTLTFGVEFNQSLAGVTLPSSLQTLTFGSLFAQSFHGTTLIQAACSPWPCLLWLGLLSPQCATSSLGLLTILGRWTRTTEKNGWWIRIRSNVCSFQYVWKTTTVYLLKSKTFPRMIVNFGPVSTLLHWATYMSLLLAAPGITILRKTKRTPLPKYKTYGWFIIRVYFVLGWETCSQQTKFFGTDFEDFVW